MLPDTGAGTRIQTEVAQVELLWLLSSSGSFDINLEFKATSGDQKMPTAIGCTVQLSGAGHICDNSPESSVCSSVSWRTLGNPSSWCEVPSLPHPSVFCPPLSCIVTFYQFDAALWVCFLTCSELKAWMSYRSDERPCECS